MRKVKIFMIDLLSIFSINLVYGLFLVIAIDSTIKDYGKDGTMIIGAILPFVIFFQTIISVVWELCVTVFSTRQVQKKKVIGFTMSNILVPIILVLDLGDTMILPYILMLIFTLCVILYKRIMKKYGLN